MKKLKLLLFLGIFALVSIPLKAQPPLVEAFPPGVYMTFDGNVYWKVINNTACDVTFKNFFSVKDDDGSNINVTTKQVNFPVLSLGNGQETTLNFFYAWFGNPPPSGHVYTIEGVLVTVSFDGGITDIELPMGSSGDKIVRDGVTGPCKCFRYYYYMSDPYHPTLTINPIVPPDTCP